MRSTSGPGTHVELRVISAPAGKLLIHCLCTRKRMVVQNHGNTGVLQRLDASLLRSAVHEISVRSIRRPVWSFRGTHEVEDTSAGVELGPTVDEALYKPVSELPERM